ncbi:INO80 complex subunit C [Trachymyrmex zeteki]|uniref:INO80 complex subunit C n=1 Tax=Mycetomoellerius zeteki TaxID=64791 RepID=A0A151WFC5_9HYME|nr:PREDICTED: INO80 complex subunit C [Trachymyrmex zeteki]XP_018316060.1 PREDICTED: INO80 complex subunit C [Trachymyrmex zeteki]XP_018374852.1 PREDICTED: INO80 complex subunit C [Trachymyrmex cornetzi]XP_018374853.1 PREDICTED: INO80 complex subunit C [Trachymyrmex cornetzi]KYQ46534.1 INO80 complex subunit C [Trachymyrmex zeteki]
MASEEIYNREANKKLQPIFKNRSFQQKFRQTSTTGKKRTWRSLKQVLAQERSLPWPTAIKHYSSINAPPSFKPAKKYSDISGLPARYTDPQTKLYYATAEEFATVRSLPMDITAGYLALRGASSIVG